MCTVTLVELSLIPYSFRQSTTLNSMFDDEERPTIHLSLMYDVSLNALIVTNVICQLLTNTKKSNPYIKL